MASIVDYLNSQKQDSSYTARAKLAEQKGISGYKGTAQQNIQLLNTLRNEQQTKKSTQPTKTTVPTKSEPQQYIDQLNEARKKEALAGLDRSRDQALSNLGQEKKQIQPRYYDARNQTASNNQQQARNFAEFMASRGGARSGANAQAEISRQGALQNNLGELRQQETFALDDIGRRTTDVNNAYESDLERTKAGIEAERLQAQLGQFNSDRQYNLQEKQFEEDVRRFGLNYAIQQAQLAASRSNAASSRALSRERFEYQKQQDAKKWELEQQQMSNEPGPNMMSPSDLNNYVNMIDSSPYFDEYTGQLTNRNGLRRYVISLNLPDEATDQLLTRYGLPINNTYSNPGSR